jgi:predicted ester cyclase
VLPTIAQGDYVVTNWKVSGTHKDPLQTPSGGSIPPTGKNARLMGNTTAQVKSSNVGRVWNYWDMTSLLGQLGLLPPM